MYAEVHKQRLLFVALDCDVLERTAYYAYTLATVELYHH